MGIAPPLFEDTLLRLLQHLDHAASQLRHLSDLRVDQSPEESEERSESGERKPSSIYVSSVVYQL